MKKQLVNYVLENIEKPIMPSKIRQVFSQGKLKLAMPHNLSEQDKSDFAQSFEDIIMATEDSRLVYNSIDGKINQELLGKSYKNIGIAPVITLPCEILSKENILTFQDKHYCALGAFPQSKAIQEGKILNKLFQEQKFDENFSSTGRWYTVNGYSGYRAGFGNKRCPEYQYKNQRYVRVASSNSDEVVWFKVEPIVCEIVNAKNLPNDLIENGDGSEKSVKLQSNSILAGFPFSLDDNLEIEKSFINAYLNDDEYRCVKNGHEIEWDFHDDGFLSQALLQEKARCDYTFNKNERSVKACAFSACKNLQTIRFPSKIDSIPYSAFQYCDNIEKFEFASSVSDCHLSFEDFPYAYVDKESGLLVISKTLPKDENSYKDLIYLKTFNKFPDFLLKKPSVSADLSKISKRMLKNNVAISTALLEYLDAKNVLGEFAQKATFKFLNNEVIKPFQKEFNLYIKDKNIENAFWIFACNLGAFSDEPLLDKFENESKTSIAQYASSLLAKIFNNYLEDFSRLLRNNLLISPSQPNSSFLRFLSKREGDSLPNLEYLFDLEDVSKGTFINVMNNFDKVVKLKSVLMNDGKIETLSTKKAIIKFLANVNFSEDIYYSYLAFNRGARPLNKSEDIDLEKSLYTVRCLSKDEFDRVLNIFKDKGISQKRFDKVIELWEEGNITKGNLLNKPVKEQPQEQIDKLKEQIQNIGEDLFSAKEKLSKLYDRHFSFEFLDKNDIRNAIIGIYCSCCANIDSVYYGKNIVDATIFDSRVQNLVVLDKNQEIVAKGALYLDKKHGYAVINDFEINAKYKKDEISKGNYSNKNQKAHNARVEIFETFLRGIKEFVKEYDRENPKKPIKYVHAGMGFNRLNDYCKQFAPSSKLLDVPKEFNFNDAKDGQYILYQNLKLKKSDDLFKDKRNLYNEMGE